MRYVHQRDLGRRARVKRSDAAFRRVARSSRSGEADDLNIRKSVLTVWSGRCTSVHPFDGGGGLPGEGGIHGRGPVRPSAKRAPSRARNMSRWGRQDRAGCAATSSHRALLEWERLRGTRSGALREALASSRRRKPPDSSLDCSCPGAEHGTTAGAVPSESGADRSPPVRGSRKASGEAAGSLGVG